MYSLEHNNDFVQANVGKHQLVTLAGQEVGSEGMLVSRLHQNF